MAIGTTKPVWFGYQKEEGGISRVPYAQEIQLKLQKEIEELKNCPSYKSELGSVSNALEPSLTRRSIEVWTDIGYKSFRLDDDLKKRLDSIFKIVETIEKAKSSSSTATDGSGSTETDKSGAGPADSLTGRARNLTNSEGTQTTNTVESGAQTETPLAAAPAPVLAAAAIVPAPAAAQDPRDQEIDLLRQRLHQLEVEFARQVAEQNARREAPRADGAPAAAARVDIAVGTDGAAPASATRANVAIGTDGAAPASATRANVAVGTDGDAHKASSNPSRDPLDENHAANRKLLEAATKLKQRADKLALAQSQKKEARATPNDDGAGPAYAAASTEIHRNPNEALREELELLRKSLAAIQRESRSKLEEITGIFERTIAEAKERNRELEERNRELASRNGVLAEGNLRIDKEYRRDLDGLRGTIRRLEREKDSAIDKAAESRGEVERLKAESTRLRNNADKANFDLQVAKNTFDKEFQKLRIAHEKVAKLSAQENTEFKMKIEGLTAQNKNLIAKIDKLAKRVRETDAQIQEKEMELVDLMKFLQSPSPAAPEASGNDAEKAALKERVEALSEKLEKLRKENAEIRAAWQKACDDKAEINGQLVDLRKIIAIDDDKLEKKVTEAAEAAERIVKTAAEAAAAAIENANERVKQAEANLARARAAAQAATAAARDGIEAATKNVQAALKMALEAKEDLAKAKAAAAEANKEKDEALAAAQATAAAAEQKALAAEAAVAEANKEKDEALAAAQATAAAAEQKAVAAEAAVAEANKEKDEALAAAQATAAAAEQKAVAAEAAVAEANKEKDEALAAATQAKEEVEAKAAAAAAEAEVATATATAERDAAEATMAAATERMAEATAATEEAATATEEAITATADAKDRVAVAEAARSAAEERLAATEAKVKETNAALAAAEKAAAKAEAKATSAESARATAAASHTIAIRKLRDETTAEIAEAKRNVITAQADAKLANAGKTAVEEHLAKQKRINEELAAKPKIDLANKETQTESSFARAHNRILAASDGGGGGGAPLSGSPRASLGAAAAAVADDEAASASGSDAQPADIEDKAAQSFADFVADKPFVIKCASGQIQNLNNIKNVNLKLLKLKSENIIKLTNPQIKGSTWSYQLDFGNRKIQESSELKTAKEKLDTVGINQFIKVNQRLIAEFDTLLKIIKQIKQARPVQATRANSEEPLMLAPDLLLNTLNTQKIAQLVLLPIIIKEILKDKIVTQPTGSPRKESLFSGTKETADKLRNIRTLLEGTAQRPGLLKTLDTLFGKIQITSQKTPLQAPTSIAPSSASSAASSSIK